MSSEQPPDEPDAEAGATGRRLEPVEAETVTPDEVIEQASERAAEQVFSVIEQRLEVFESHAGPLPAPETLAAYEAQMPGLAEKIVSWTDSEVKHRQELERQSVAGALTLGTRAQIIGAILMLLAFVLIFTGHDGAGIVALAPTIAAFVTAQVGPTLRRRLGSGDGDEE